MLANMDCALNKTCSPACLALAAFLTGLSCALAGAATEQGTQQDGEISTANAPRQHIRLADFPVRDPWIMAHRPSNTYYLYPSNNGPPTAASRPPTIHSTRTAPRLCEGP